MPVVYTVITNGYDQLKDPKKKSTGWRYVCFSDKPVHSDVWEWVPYCENNRKVKILGHLYFEGLCLYVDGSIQIRGDLNKLLSVLPSVFTIAQHRKRHCLFDEAKLLLSRGTIPKEIAEPQVQKYLDDGFPLQWGLGENNIMLRDFSDTKTQDVNELWWEEYCDGVSRDQVSLMYCLWKIGVTHYLAPHFIISDFFRKTKHLHER